MIYLRAATTLFLGAVLSSAVACSSDDDNDAGSNGPGAPGSSGGSGFDPNAQNGDGSTPSVEDLRDSACAGWSAEPENQPAVLQLVVDTSRSMTERAPGSRNSKWEVTRDALDRAIADLPGSTAVGLLFYPNRNTDRTTQQASDIEQCINTDALIPIEVLGADGSAHRNRIAEALDEARPDGYTPTHDAYWYALENGLKPSRAIGNRFMLVITDGAPTLARDCRRGPPGDDNNVTVVETDPIVDEIAQAKTENISTFLIGSPGSEEGSNGEDMRPWLSRAAVAGGTAGPSCDASGPNFCHMDMTQEPDFAAALSAGLAAIAGSIVSCSYELPAPPPNETIDLDRINAIYTPESGEPQIIGRAPDGDCSEGWQLVDGNRIELCPETCNLVQSDATASFELLFGCEPVPTGVE